MRFSFHNHTNFSHDCTVSLEQLERRCVELGIEVIAITDHHTAQGAFRAAEQFKDVHVVVGQEIETKEGEVIGLFLTEEIARGLPFADILKQIHAQGGLVVVPHPFDRLRRHVLSHEALMEHLDDIDVIETFNARAVFPEDNDKAAAFAKKYGKLGIAGNDAHTLREQGSVVITLDDFHDGPGLLRALKHATVQAKRSPLWVHGVTKVVKWRSQFRHKNT
jgi:predicted metal-dependent phosphoesterase TrpH